MATTMEKVKSNIDYTINPAIIAAINECTKSYEVEETFEVYNVDDSKIKCHYLLIIDGSKVSNHFQTGDYDILLETLLEKFEKKRN